MSVDWIVRLLFLYILNRDISSQYLVRNIDSSQGCLTPLPYQPIGHPAQRISSPTSEPLHRQEGARTRWFRGQRPPRNSSPAAFPAHGRAYMLYRRSERYSAWCTCCAPGCLHLVLLDLVPIRRQALVDSSVFRAWSACLADLGYSFHFLMLCY